MNKIFKVVWSKVKNCYVVVSEIAKVNSKNGIKSKQISKASLAATLAVAVMMSSNVLAADVEYTGNSYILNNADGSDNVTITTTGTNKYNVQMKSGTITVGNLTLNNQYGGIELAKESKQTVAILNADDIAINGSSYYAFFAGSTGLGGSAEALAGSSFIINANSITTSNKSEFALAGEGKSITINAKTISSSGDVSGLGNIEINADDISIGSIHTRADYTGDELADFNIIASNELTVNGTIGTAAGRITLLGGESIAIKDDIYVSELSAGEIGEVDISSMVGKVTIEGNIEAEKGVLNLNLNTSDSFIVGEINTGTNENANISLNNGATWYVKDGVNYQNVSKLSGDYGVIAVDPYTLVKVRIKNNQNNNLIII